MILIDLNRFIILIDLLVWFKGTVRVRSSKPVWKVGNGNYYYLVGLYHDESKYTFQTDRYIK